MKKTSIFLLLTACLLLTVSCYKEEELDTNADITGAYIPKESQRTEPSITNTSVTFKVKSNVDVTKQSPVFTLSPNATITPDNGITRDFSKSQTYVVTAQDQRWQKTYTVSFTSDELSTFYNFNNYELVDKNRYHQFYEIGSNGEHLYIWKSGNQGYATLAGSTPPEGYPTSAIPGRNGGYAVNMQTISTGRVGAWDNKPIAAGNLFIGDFKLNNLFPSKSTKFGEPYSGDLPKSLRGVFKYKKGEKVTDKFNNEIKGAVDTFDIYAIIFEKRDKNNYLEGDHAFKDSRMIALARINPDQRIETDNWTEFEAPFLLQEGKTFNPKEEYMLTIVMSSSIEGEKFIGAVGSTLIVDEIELVYEK